MSGLTVNDKPKQAPLNGDGTIVGVASNYADLLEVIRQRKEAAGFTNLELDHRAGLAPGYSGKIFSLENPKRLGAQSLGLVLEALNLRLVIVSDGDLPVPIRPKNHSMDRSGPRHWRRRASRAAVRCDTSYDRAIENHEQPRQELADKTARPNLRAYRPGVKRKDRACGAP